MSTRERYEALRAKRDNLKDSLIQSKARLTALTERKQSVIEELKRDYNLESEEALSEAISMLDSEIEKNLTDVESLSGK